MLKKFYLFAFVIAFMFSITSAIAPTSTKNANVPTKELLAGNLDYKNLKGIAEQAKGSKLSLKEKIGLKIFGKKVKDIKKNTGTKGKGRTTALVLGIFLGSLGIHRFYLGYTWQGVVQLLTGGGCGIWALIDWIRIITGDLKPKEGDYDPDWK